MIKHKKELPRGNSFLIVKTSILTLEHTVTTALVKGRIEGVEVL